MARWVNLQSYVKQLSKLSFWRSRSQWLKAKFEYNKKVYSAKEFMNDRQGDVNILQVLVWSTFFSFLFSLIFLAILLLLPFPEIQDKYIDNCEPTEHP